MYLRDSYCDIQWNVFEIKTCLTDWLKNDLKYLYNNSKELCAL
jgi:hypothetical protein